MKITYSLPFSIQENAKCLFLLVVSLSLYFKLSGIQRLPGYTFPYVCIWHLFLIREFDVDFILLAGYLKLIPVELIQAYPKCILNIHPSLLPAFGGKGYYGMKVHKAVIASGARYMAMLLLLYILNFEMLDFGTNNQSWFVILA